MRLGLIITTLGFGLRHGIDWDHIAAIADLTGSQERPRRSMVLATLYVLGHAVVVFALGCAAIVFADRLPSTVDGAMERVVGVTLVVLGAYVLIGLVRHGRDFRMRSRWMLVFAGARRLVRWARSGPAETVVITHDHEHGADHVHIDTEVHDAVAAGTGGTAADGHGAGHDHPHHHPHRHVAAMPDDPFPTYGNLTAWVIGMLHGVGAETPTQVVLFVTAAGVAGRAAGMALLLCFIAGLVVSNTAIALASTYGFLRASGSYRVYAAVSITIAVFSLAMGALFIAGNGDVFPTIFS